MQDFDKLWNYADPAATEIKFRDLLSNIQADDDLSYYLQLLTQIARTHSLRRQFAEAHQVLDEVELKLPDGNDVAHVRYHLERGRTFNSSAKRDEATRHFELAKVRANEINAEGFLIDAMHMLAIVSGPEMAIRINEEAIINAESSGDEHARRWLGSLYNNLGWGYFDMGQYEKALSIFLRALKWFEDKKAANETFIAKWTVARTLRALNRNKEALTIQLGLFEEASQTGRPDGYVHEELGELFLIEKDELKTGFHFEKAYSLLKDDPYMEKDRLERIKTLAAK